MKNNFSINDIARFCHKAYQAFCQSIGEDMPPNWKLISEEEKEATRLAVLGVVENPDVTAIEAFIELAIAEIEAQHSAGYVECGCPLISSTIHPSQLLWNTMFRNLVLALMPMLPVVEPDPVIEPDSSLVVSHDILGWEKVENVVKVWTDFGLWEFDISARAEEAAIKAMGVSPTILGIEGFDIKPRKTEYGPGYVAFADDILFPSEPE